MNTTKKRVCISFLAHAECVIDPCLLEKILLREENLIQRLTKDELIRHRGLLGTYPDYKDAYYNIKRVLRNEKAIEQAYY